MPPKVRRPADAVQLKITFSESLRQKLEEASKKSYRSMTAEIVYRLEQSFQQAVSQEPMQGSASLPVAASEPAREITQDSLRKKITQDVLRAIASALNLPTERQLENVLPPQSLEEIEGVLPRKLNEAFLHSERFQEDVDWKGEQPPLIVRDPKEAHRRMEPLIKGLKEDKRKAGKKK